MAKKKTPGSDVTPTPETSAASTRRSAPARRAAPTRQPRPARSTATEEMHLAAADDAVAEPRAGTPAYDEAGAPTYDEIARAAYLKYLERGGRDGGDLDDWVTAERELRERRSR